MKYVRISFVPASPSWGSNRARRRWQYLLQWDSIQVLRHESSEARCQSTDHCWTYSSTRIWDPFSIHKCDLISENYTHHNCCEKLTKNVSLNKITKYVHAIAFDHRAQDRQCLDNWYLLTIWCRLPAGTVPSNRRYVTDGMCNLQHQSIKCEEMIASKLSLAIETNHISIECFRLSLLSYATTLLCQPSKPLPLTYILILFLSHISFQILTDPHSSENLAALLMLAFSHDWLPGHDRGYEEQSMNQSNDSKNGE